MWKIQKNKFFDYLGDRMDETPAVSLSFKQRVNHFDPTPDGVFFNQRVHVNAQYFKSGNPVFLYVGGEAELTSRSVLKGAIVDLAKQHEALVVGVEHRFYGKSHPFANLTTENLQYLSTEQALEDLAYFIAEAPYFLAEKAQIIIPPSTKWIAVGGSYPANLAAWVRLKFPHLVSASWASSGPVLAKSEFWEYDRMVRQQLGDSCSDMISQATKLIEDVIERNNSFEVELIKNIFHPDMDEIKDDVAFLYVLADIVAYTVQYDNPGVGLRQRLCNRADSPFMNPLYALKLFGKFVRYFFDVTDSNPKDMDMTSYNRTDIRDPSENQRQWMWQCCTEYGFWQVAPEKNPLRSKFIDEKWHLVNICHGLFGLSPKHRVPTEVVNTRYGARGIISAVDKIVFVNGDRDPWSTLSVLPNNGTGNNTCPSFLVKGVGHCADLHAQSPSDPESLIYTRNTVFSILKSWI